MLCPQCGHDEHKVICTEKVMDGNTIRRIRQCASCGMVWTTREVISRETKGGYIPLGHIE